jgi:Ca2+-binding RTX toxin-like protein
MNTVLGTASNDYISGSGSADLIYGYAGDDVIFPGDGDDEIFGGDGSDQIQYSPGSDIMRGGAGDDQYFVNNEGDRVIELAGEGDRDQVTTTVDDYVLPLNVESLYLDGEAKTALGNDQNNQIISLSATDTSIHGYGGDDFIVGGLGASRLYGNDGNDTLSVNDDAIGDLLNGGNGDDRLIGSKGSDRLVGGAGNDILFGFSAVAVGNDILTGTDTVIGGDGADIFDLNGSPVAGAPAISPTLIGYLGEGNLVITDFNRAQGDKIRADLKQVTYTLSEANGSTSISLGADLIAIVQGVVGLSIAQDFIQST